MNKEDKEFPIQRSYRPIERAHPLTIPWKIAELAYSVYVSHYGSSQSLERLAARGGFHAGEMDRFLPDWREQCAEIADLRARLAELEKAVQSAVYGIDCMKLNSVAYTPDSIREGLTTALTKLQENK